MLTVRKLYTTTQKESDPHEKTKSRQVMYKEALLMYEQADDGGYNVYGLQLVIKKSIKKNVNAFFFINAVHSYKKINTFLLCNLAIYRLLKIGKW